LSIDAIRKIIIATNTEINPEITRCAPSFGTASIAISARLITAPTISTHHSGAGRLEVTESILPWRAWMSRLNCFGVSWCRILLPSVVGSYVARWFWSVFDSVIPPVGTSPRCCSGQAWATT